MGDRANICIRHGNEKIYLYSHWGGCELYQDAHRALSKKWRWNDPAYLTRIVFDEMIGDNQGSETSYGIWTKPSDNDGYPIIVLDTKVQKVFFEDPEKHGTYKNNLFDYSQSWTFSDFINMAYEEIEKFYSYS